MDWDRFDEMLGQCGVRVRSTKAAAGRERDSSHRELAGLVKIKRKSANLHIVYRPVDDEDANVAMEIIAIGPRDHDKVYKEAARRMTARDSELPENQSSKKLRGCPGGFFF
ncbi:hypothetical protein [Kyrpidia spormannii]|uniref:Plasmid stabilization system n=1 Tax=Kyrpidia spormannii TaxID=2055160 RepID=A0ACA8ZE14_9BACL|nr:hypothetical protein [Kyrpidia spormannii]CAB3393201.1 Plasmid stabilization system [Kyrpidia spormannii]